MVRGQSKVGSPFPKFADVNQHPLPQQGLLPKLGCASRSWEKRRTANCGHTETGKENLQLAGTEARSTLRKGALAGC